jgi:uncharacterized membrane protein YdcZ (DUF606 family)
LLAVAAIGASGSLVTAHNGAIGQRLGALRATRVFMTAGTVVGLACVVAVERSTFDPGLQASLPAYALLPGVLNTIIVAAVIRLVRVLGTLQIMASVFTGSVCVGLLLDHVGAFALPTIAVSGPRLVGAACLVAGVALLAVRLGRRTDAGVARSAPPAWAVWAALACGAVDAASVAMNTTMAGVAGPFSATVAFLLPGALVMSLALRARPARPAALRASDLIPGVWNVAALAVALAVIPTVGLHVANAARFAAAIAAGTAIDHRGTFGGVRIPVSGARLAAAALLVIGVLASLP